VAKPSTEGDPAPGGASRSPLTLIAGLRCDECGVFGAFDLGERQLCEDCYRACGSCCLEFGADDLWSKDP
jgi:hypothetical protein